MNGKQTDRMVRLLPDGIPRYVRIYDNGGGLDRFCRKCCDFHNSAETSECPVCFGKLLKATGGTFDRFTVVFSGRYAGRDGRCDYLGMSSRPTHPQGFGQHGESDSPLDAPLGFPPKIGDISHLGRRIPWDNLPFMCQDVVLDDYAALWGVPRPWRVLLEYQVPRSFSDAAWAQDDGVTNYKLKDGDRVTLQANTKGDASKGNSGVIIPKGAAGIVKHARTPRVRKPSDTNVDGAGWSNYFANVDFVSPCGETHRARVPHNALKRR